MNVVVLFIDRLFEARKRCCESAKTNLDLTIFLTTMVPGELREVAAPWGSFKNDSFTTRRRRWQVRAKVSISLTPKALRVEELRAQGKSFDEAFVIADHEYTPDGLLLRRGTTDLDAVLSGGLAQMGEVQF
jgi:hypothetical protein